MKLVIITWVDSSFPAQSGWVSRTCEVIEAKHCVSTGMVSHEDEDFITLSHSINSNQHVEAITIPKVSIKSMRKLRVK